MEVKQYVKLILLTFLWERVAKVHNEVLEVFA